MLSIQSLSAFFLVSMLLAVTPGPDNLFVLSQGLLRGRLAGLAVTLGLCTGLILHTSLVAFGLAVIFTTSTLAFNLLKLFGAGYLCYLAWLAFQSRESQIDSLDVQLTIGRLYRRGIIMNATNPKVSLFFLVFLPQFTDPASGSVTLQVMLLGGLFMLATLLVFGGVALVAGQIGIWLNRTANQQRFMQRAVGVVFILLAINLLLMKHP